MSRIILLFFLFFSTGVAKENIWRAQHSYSLKKDEVATVVITSDDKAGGYPINFRWTLYDGSRNLIVLLNYRGYPHQYVLRDERMRNSIQIPLLARERGSNLDCFALIIFTGFDVKKKRANFEIYIKDVKNRILVKFEKRK